MLKSFATFRTESIIGAIFLALLSGFLIGFLFIQMKNLESDTMVIESNTGIAKSISPLEMSLIDDWIIDYGIKIPGDKRYDYVFSKYPNKPWLGANGN